MIGTSPSASPAVPAVPLPRRPLTAGGAGGQERMRWWYESVLGWPTAPGAPVRLRVGDRFDVLDVPAEAGHAALRRLGRPGPACEGPRFPVAVRGERMLLLVAAGGADELPGLLEWLEWGSLELDLTAVGAGGLMRAPLVPGTDPAGLPPRTPGRDGSQGAAVWLRPPEPGCEAEASLPTLSALGGTGTALDLAGLVRALATQCHRVRLSRATR
ncbi:SCO3374 family protein [Streptomyces lancefieldiae]|uniref:SCO3374 family protein n=1 Tax=Streptomyces lancefieldiae TaxID=3075520 RepID=A0ABU3AX07_9ACTN|nr:SCO3374 family protein [Streptomyces sp. DSM 40712]MDT0614726.1 SCO3374 family protein [Streptomyces sp. DSM 40712]